MKHLFSIDTIAGVFLIFISPSTISAEEETSNKIENKNKTEIITFADSTSNKQIITNSKQSIWSEVLKVLPTISGYLQTGWNYSTAGKESSSFQAKRLRLILDDPISNIFSLRLQLELFNGISGSTNGNGQKNVQVMDAFVTTKLSNEFQIRTGQFYLPLGYENYDISPATLETIDFSNICYRMVCRNPISYNFIDYGRDIGVMILGDLFPNLQKEFYYVSYNMAITNGSLPSKDDNNKSKDFVTALEVRPTKFLNLKGSFNWGKYAGSLQDSNTGTTKTYQHQGMTRYIFGIWYNDPTGIDFRTEYGHIQSKDKGNYIVKENGCYILVGYHAGNFLPILKYELYRDNILKNSTNNFNSILCGLTYQINKSIKIQTNYSYIRYKNNVKAAIGKSGANQIQIMGMYKF
ncbi:OprO/OprP family phosphate-selective porin [Prevotella cerevisiae]|uniref:OprO/OprP family phosphate-selective porin n=1 Tax=Segatella cerevisiae TaxID=2053716 RepID=A0ABT1BZM3_9BACT|nr:porin [Segatella cerevisiae]MCO6026290.1 OprO/OprP family phosphate-selective porin [Segatella cerevisiae]